MESLSLDTDTEVYNIVGTDYIATAGICNNKRNGSTTRGKIDIIKNLLFILFYP